MPGLGLLLSQDIGVQRAGVKSDRVCSVTAPARGKGGRGEGEGRGGEGRGGGGGAGGEGGRREVGARCTRILVLPSHRQSKSIGGGETSPPDLGAHLWVRGLEVGNRGKPLRPPGPRRIWSSHLSLRLLQIIFKTFAMPAFRVVDGEQP